MNHNIEQLDMSLLENGLDFVTSALNYFRGTPSPKDLKYGVVHLCSGVELVLKVRLVKEHWSLVFENTNKANKESFEKGDFSSATFDTCLDRLVSICDIKTLDKHRMELKRFREKRNRIEHFKITDSIQAIKASASKVLSIVLDFINNELDDDVVSEYDHEINEIRRRLSDFEKFVIHRMNQIRHDLSASDSTIVECPRCTQKSAVAFEGLRCLFCGYINTDPDDAAQEYISDIIGETKYSVVKDGGEWPLYSCVECEQETMVSNYNTGEYSCFSCGGHWNRHDVEHCDSCGNPFLTTDGEVMCESCIRWRMAE